MSEAQVRSTAGSRPLAAATALDADLTAEVVRRAVAGMALQLTEASVVVLDQRHRPVRCTVISAALVARVAEHAADDALLRDLLHLDDFTPAAVIDLATPEGADATGLALGSVVMRGPQVVGIVASDDGQRGAPPAPVRPGRTTGQTAPPPPPVPPPAPAMPPDPPVDLPPDPPVDLPRDSTVDLPVARPTSHAKPPQPSARFHAFPRAEAPAEAVGGVSFPLVVGFTQERPTLPTDATPVTVMAAPPVMAFEVQVAGFGFDFPDGVTFPLEVDRDLPTATVSIPVVAQPVPARTSRSIQITYAFGGAVVGEAWSDLVVVPVDAPADSGPGAVPVPAPSGGTGVGSTETEPPDLTVTIRTTPGRPEIEWLFQTPHDVPRPTGRVQTAFQQGTAEAFATQLMEQLPAGKDQPLLIGDVGGLGLRVAAAYPPEFWQTVDAVWRKVPSGTVPTLLLITGEPFVPWELALMEADRHVGADLLDPGDRLPMLGALWAIGRWLAPVRQPFGPDRPSAPPDELVDAPTMVVVKGDYRAGGVKALPGAVRESEELALAYSAVTVGIDEQSVTTLMNDGVLDSAAQPYHPVVVHFAAHGQVGTTNQQYTGIVLDNRRLLGPLAIEASALGRATKPFVFLNACQVGVAAYLLNGYGGLASAFVMSGARGFVAPLWNVDDDLAHVLSAAFYQRVLDQGETVGEALRQMRRGFVDGGGRTATPLAYVFYGHPRLRLTRPA